MPLDHYVTLGRSGLRVSPLCLGAMTFGEELGWGSSVKDSEAIIDRYLERGGNFIDTANGYTRGHSEKIIGDHLGRAREQARPRRDRHQVHRQPLPRRSQRRRREPQGHLRAVRAVAAAPADRLHRPLLDARLGQAHAHRGDDARAPRPGAGGQGPLHRRLRHAGVEGGAGATDRRRSAGGRRSSRCRSSTRCWSARSRASSSPWRASSGSASRPGRRSRAACSAASTPATTPASTRRRAAPGCSSSLNDKAYAIVDELDRDRRRARHHAGARGARLGAGPAGRHLHHHRRAHAGAARRQPHGARGRALAPADRRRSTRSPRRSSTSPRTSCAWPAPSRRAAPR